VVEVGDLPWIEIDFEGDLKRAREATLSQVEALDSRRALPTA
jgi:choline kinase